MTLYGWADPDCLQLVFSHQVTLLDDRTVVDATATQFRHDLPAPWVAPLADYTAALAAAAGVHTVTAGMPPIAPPTTTEQAEHA